MLPKCLTPPPTLIFGRHIVIFNFCIMVTIAFRTVHFGHLTPPPLLAKFRNLTIYLFWQLPLRLNCFQTSFSFVNGSKSWTKLDWVWPISAPLVLYYSCKLEECCVTIFVWRARTYIPDLVRSESTLVNCSWNWLNICKIGGLKCQHFIQT